jgi:hypothetical protein
LPCLLAISLHARGAWFRLAGCLLILAVLSGPRWLMHQYTTLPDIAVILVDQSHSMDIGARNALAASALAGLRASAGATALSVTDIPESDSGGSLLAPSLAQALASVQPDQLAGIVIITDGEIADAASLPKNIPVTALLTAKSEEKDRELRLLSTPAYGLVGQTVNLQLEVIDHGVDDDSGPAEISISEDGTPVADRSVRISQPFKISLPVRHAGPMVVTATAPPLPREVTAINNSAAFTLTGIHKRLNVLLISGTPDQGERAWRLLLKSDPAVQLVHFTILRTPGEPIDVDPKDLALVPFPVRELFETDIQKFNLIILDDFNADDLLPTSYLQNITNYVQDGGALLTETGPEFNAPDSLAFSLLGPVIPATPLPEGTITQPFVPNITAIGARHPVTSPFANMKLTNWYRMQPATASAGNILMTGANNLPLLILADAGNGRAGILLSDQLWLWTRGGNHSGPALPLLRRIVHWLLREPALEAESLGLSIVNHRLTITRQTLGNCTPCDVALTTPGGALQETALRASVPGTYTATVDAAASGVWQARQANLTAYATNSDTNLEEFQDLAATSANFRGIARNIIWLGTTPAPPLRALLSPRHARQVTNTSSVPLLPPLPSLAIALALIVSGWWRESRPQNNTR